MQLLLLPYRPNLVITANTHGPQPMAMDLPALAMVVEARGPLNLDITDMEAMRVTMAVALHMLDVPFGVWVNDQLMLNPRLKLMPNLDMDMAMDMDMVVMVIMVMVIMVTVMVMDTVTMVRSFRKIFMMLKTKTKQIYTMQLCSPN